MMASKAIIRELQRDGRTSYAELGKAGGIERSSCSPTSRASSPMPAVMQIVAVTDPSPTGVSPPGDDRHKSYRGCAAQVAEATLKAIEQVDYLVSDHRSIRHAR
jgi:hypothetical protein